MLRTQPFLYPLQVKFSRLFGKDMPMLVHIMLCIQEVLSGQSKALESYADMSNKDWTEDVSANQVDS